MDDQSDTVGRQCKERRRRLGCESKHECNETGTVVRRIRVRSVRAEETVIEEEWRTGGGPSDA